MGLYLWKTWSIHIATFKCNDKHKLVLLKRYSLAAVLFILLSKNIKLNLGTFLDYPWWKGILNHLGAKWAWFATVALKTTILIGVLKWTLFFKSERWPIYTFLCGNIWNRRRRLGSYSILCASRPISGGGGGDGLAVRLFISSPLKLWWRETRLGTNCDNRLFRFVAILNGHLVCVCVCKCVLVIHNIVCGE